MTAIDMNRPRHEINVLDRDFIRDPWEGYARLRAEQPIFFDDVNDLWVLTRSCSAQARASGPPGPSTSRSSLSMASGTSASAA